MNKFLSGLGIVYLAVIIAGFIGWVMNFFHCVGYLTGANVDSTAETVIRAVGIIAAPLGAIAGYF